MKIGILAALAVVSAATSANAAVEVYFGENLNPFGSVAGQPVTARNGFFDRLLDTSVENFDSFVSGASPSSLTFTGSAGDITASFSGVGSVLSGVSGVGRFATSGANWYETNAGLSISFSTEVAAFGFYGTDIGDFNGQLSVTLTRASGTETILVPHTLNAPNASLLFFGIIDTANPFTAIQFGTTTGDDYFGFDDLTIGDVRQVTPSPAVPEPGTWALLIAGFGVVGLAARRRRAITA